VASPLARRLAVFLVTAVACGMGAWLGAWWVPFLAGVAVGVLGGAWLLPDPVVPRGGVLAALAGGLAGWLVPLWTLALAGQPAGATARAIVALAGLPASAVLAIAVVALLAALQVLAGAWLGRAAVPRRTVP
jgi:hypothetical protein